MNYSHTELDKTLTTTYCLGVIFTDGPLWVEHRRFTIRSLKDFGFGKKDAEGIILEETEELIKEIKEMKIVQVSH
jgi:hypothetical protein